MMKSKYPNWLSWSYRSIEKPKVRPLALTRNLHPVIEDINCSWISFKELYDTIRMLQSKVKDSLKENHDLSLKTIRIENNEDDEIYIAAYLDKKESDEEWNKRVFSEKNSVLIWEYFNEDERTRPHLLAILSVIEKERTLLHKREDFAEMDSLEEEINKQLKLFKDSTEEE